MLRSATFKLTMYYVLIIAVISIGFSTALYHVAVNDLAFGLQQQTRRISNDFPVFEGSPYLTVDHDLTAGKQHIIGRLVIFNIFVLALAGLVSYALARRTLQPIEDNHERQKRFTADVSHELRTPLTALTMESQVALMDAGATKAQLTQVIKSNVEEAEKLTRLVTNLLKISQLEDATALTTAITIQVNEVIQAAINQVQPLAQARGIKLKYSDSPAAAVRGDQDLLNQLLIIVLDNAIKYSTPDSAVTIAATTTANEVVISIKDQGIGIAKHDLEHIFDRFYRADAARSSAQASGFGLGLSIAKLIADVHAAAITLTSKPGHGTTAELRLPLVVLNKR